ncbi:MAG: xanthine dehydrogenase family protein molybdopterin-binding subunit [Actinomycetota bacterium]
MTAIGASPNRSGGHARVTGHQEYLADLATGDVLHVKLVKLDCARARIISIDTTAAEAVPGVAFVMTAADLPQPVPLFGPQFKDRPPLAVGETKFHGEPVAAVAAATREAAEEAARLVVVEHEVLDGVFSVADALDPAKPLVQDPAGRPGDPLNGSNVRTEHHFGWGDTEAAEAAAHLVVDHNYQFPMVTHFAIEPHGFMAAPDGDGIVIWSTIQHPFWLQKIMADLLDLPLSKVRIIAPDLGGGFGGKQQPKYEPLIAFMALRAGRPVRLILTLDETFQAVRRAAIDVRVRTGFQEDGTILFEEFECNFLVGAYVDIADRVVTKSSYLAAGPYRVPNVKIVARALLSHTTPSTAFRGFGLPQISWGRELNLDEGARALGIDTVQIRLRNLPEYGEEFVLSDPPDRADGRWRETVEKAAELIGWDTPVPPGRGRGISLGTKSGPTTGLSYSTVRLLADGSAMVFSGTSDMGQGARTVFAQIAANELGIPVSEVTVVMGDTATVPYDQQTSASRSTVIMGNAVLKAARDILGKVKRMAAEHYDVDESEITIEDGIVRLPDRKFTVVEVARAALAPLGGEVIGNGEDRWDQMAGHPLGGPPVFFEFNATAVEVGVDEETGEIVIHRYVTVSDVGKALNPNQVHGQDEGAAIQGLGHTLMEHYIMDDAGRIRNLGALDYRVPTSKDLPKEILVASIENGDGPGPYGAKGVSEGALLANSAAVGSAVYEATGVVIRDLPLTPERVWRALKERT